MPLKKNAYIRSGQIWMDTSTNNEFLVTSTNQQDTQCTMGSSSRLIHFAYVRSNMTLVWSPFDADYEEEETVETESSDASVIELDTVNLDMTTAQWLLPRLTYFADHTYSYPSSFDNMGDWIAVLQGIIKALEWFALEDRPVLTDVELNTHKRNMRLLGEFFGDLWM